MPAGPPGDPIPIKDPKPKSLPIRDKPPKPPIRDDPIPIRDKPIPIKPPIRPPPIPIKDKDRPLKPPIKDKSVIKPAIKDKSKAPIINTTRKAPMIIDIPPRVKPKNREMLEILDAFGDEMPSKRPKNDRSLAMRIQNQLRIQPA